MRPPRPGLENLKPALPFIEILALIIIIGICFYIYFKTKRIEDLSSHKGINYLRKAFLFFGLSFLIQIILFGSRFQMLPNLKILYILPLSLSLIAILYLFYSLLWKKLNREWLIYIIALLIPILERLFFNRLIALLFFQILISGIFFYVLYKKFNESKKGKQILLIYLLLVVFWLINGVGLVFSRILEIDRNFITILKVIVFIIILIKVREKFKLK